MGIIDMKYKDRWLTPQESSQVLTFYKIARIRMKISYHAWLKGVSAKNLIYLQILNSYFKLCPDSDKQAFDIDKMLSSFSLIEIL